MNFFEVLLKLIVATLCGGIVGIERGRKNRPAGFRTYILVCIGATLTMILGQYLTVQTGLWGNEAATSDISRLGAQVINGIGFLGAGTIIVTGHNKVKGMTTSAGLWASACMGLAIGAGFWSGAAVGCALIIITIMVLSKLESFILSRSRIINLFVEMEEMDALSRIIEEVKGNNVKIFDVELTKGGYTETKYPNAVFSLCLPRKMSHAIFIARIAAINDVRSIEEM